MKAIVTFSIDSEVAAKFYDELGKAGFDNRSEFMQGILAQITEKLENARKTEPLPEQKLCAKCGARYASTLPFCPGCLK